MQNFVLIANLFIPPQGVELGDQNLLEFKQLGPGAISFSSFFPNNTAFANSPLTNSPVLALPHPLSACVRQRTAV